MELGDIVKWVLLAVGSLGGSWALLPKKVKGIVTAWFSANSARLKYIEDWELYRDKQLERMMNTLKHSEKVREEMEAVLREKDQMLQESLKQNATLKIQIRDQARMIEKQNGIMEQQQLELDEVQSLLRKFRIYIKKLERLLRQNDIEFEEMNTRD